MWWKKREERDGGEWLIGAHTQNIDTLPFQLYSCVVHDKKKGA